MLTIIITFAQIIEMCACFARINIIKMIEQNFIELLAGALDNHWVLPAYTNYEEGKTYTYADTAKWISKVHIVLSEAGILKGDKVALVAKDSAEWCMTWLGIVTYGAVIVPILPDFHGDDIRNIIRHSDAKVVFVGNEHIKHILKDSLPEVKAVLSVGALELLSDLSRDEHLKSIDFQKIFDEKYPKGFDKSDIHYPVIDNNELMLISYTSGTTGFSKGVMSTANNLAANMQVTMELKLFERGKNILCFLPNAHAYSAAFNFLLSLVTGCHVFILGAKPTPSVLLKAFKEVRPHMILTVPLVLEKIYKNVIVPKINSRGVSLALKIPGINNAIYGKIRRGLIEAMGGEMKEVIIGGAALNDEVGRFLSKARFPYTVGYGMTECAPLISYVGNSKYVPSSCGMVLDSIEEVRISEPREVDGVMIGEVQVRGENVCLGYYKEPELTANLFTEDGWMRTGDLGFIDEHKNIFLRGRSKSMILGANGQNIYPEEIEAKIVMLPYMSEAVVVHRNGTSIIAIVTLDKVALKRDGKDNDADIKEILKENRKALNQNISSFAAVSDFEVLDGDFEKTPKQSIKRYLYK